MDRCGFTIRVEQLCQQDYVLNDERNCVVWFGCSGVLFSTSFPVSFPSFLSVFLVAGAVNSYKHLALLSRSESVWWTCCIMKQLPSVIFFNSFHFPSKQTNASKRLTRMNLGAPFGEMRSAELGLVETTANESKSAILPC